MTTFRTEQALTTYWKKLLFDLLSKLSIHTSKVGIPSVTALFSRKAYTAKGNMQQFPTIFLLIHRQRKFHCYHLETERKGCVKKPYYKNAGLLRAWKSHYHWPFIKASLFTNDSFYNIRTVENTFSNTYNYISIWPLLLSQLLLWHILNKGSALNFGIVNFT